MEQIGEKFEAVNSMIEKFSVIVEINDGTQHKV